VTLLTRCAAPVLVAVLIMTGAASVADADTGPVTLDRAGDVSAWGYADPSVTTVPSSLQGKAVTSVAATDGATLAVTADGKVTVWGDTRYNNAFDLGHLPTGLKHVTSVCVNQDNAVALNSDGTVVGWGLDNTGVDDVPDTIQGRVTKIACGVSVGMALLDDGTVSEWGNNGTGDNAPPSGLTNVIDIAAPTTGDGYGYATGPFLAVKSDHTVVSWGPTAPDANNEGQMNVPPEVQGNAVAVYSGGWSGAAILTTGKAVFWGYMARQIPPALADATVTDIALDFPYSAALTSDGHVYVLGSSNTDINTAVYAIPGSVQDHATAIAVGGFNFAAITPAFTVATAPVITGTARQGQTLTAADATFGGGQAPDSVSTQWLADDIPIANATGTSLFVTAGLVGKTITVAQTATLGAGADAQTLIATSVGVGPVTAAPVPQIRKTRAVIGKLVLKPQRFAKFKKARAVVAVTTAGHIATGTVTIVLKNKKVSATLKRGKATLKVKKLAKAAKKGINKFTITYSGDAHTMPAKRHTKLKLK